MAVMSSTSEPRSAPLDQQRFMVRLIDSLVVPTFAIDRSHRVVMWNKACERLTNVPAAEILHTSDHWRAFYQAPRPCLADLVIRGAYNDIQVLYSDLTGFGIGDFGVTVENWCPMPRLGETRYLSIDAAPIYDDDGTVIAAVETLRDITTQMESQNNLRHLAAKDALTGLANRRSFDETMASEVRRALAEQKSLSLLMIDVDQFKLYNDTYGHRQGDMCLKAIADAIQNALRRNSDLPARYGGEEFAVILPNTEASGALRIAERIRQAVEALNIVHRSSSVADHVTISIGAATGSGCGLEAEKLLAAADDALYESKHAGRNCCVTADVGLSFILF